MTKRYNTGGSTVVPDQSTNPAQRYLTSVCWWERVCSTWYDCIMPCQQQTSIYKCIFWSTLSPVAIFVRCWAPENCPIGWIHTLNPWNWSPKVSVHISSPILAILGHKLQRQFWGLSTPFPTVFSFNHWHRLVKSFSDIFWCSKKLSKRKSYGQKRVFFCSN